MLFRIDPIFFELFPDAKIAAVYVSGLDNRGKSSEIEALVRNAEKDLPQMLQGSPLTEHPRIAPWRDAYRQFGAKPKKYPSSIENLVRRTLKGETSRHINKLVDIYNAISLRHLVPVGGEDLDRVEGDIVLTRAGEKELPIKLLGENEERAPVAGEVFYRDEVGAICRRWNWKEADRTKLTEETQNAVLVIESLPPVGLNELESAAADLAGRIEEHCGGTIRARILDEAHRQIDLGAT